MFVFFGTSENSIIVLKRLINEGYHCVAVITIPDKPVGRKQILTPSPVKLFAKKKDLPVFAVSNLSDLSDLGNLSDLLIPPKRSEGGATFAIVADFGLLIPAELIRAFPKGILNIHPSLLPAYQGATPAPFQILRGEREGGITIITINEKFDQGSILSQQKFPLTKNETTVTFLARSFTLGAQLLVKILPDYLDGRVKPIPQDLSKKSYFPRLSREDGFISWNILQKALKEEPISPSENPKFTQIAQIPLITPKDLPIMVERAIRAFTPWPGLWTLIEINKLPKRLKLLKSHIAESNLVLDLVQLEAKNPVSWIQFQKAYLLC